MHVITNNSRHVLIKEVKDDISLRCLEDCAGRLNPNPETRKNPLIHGRLNFVQQLSLSFCSFPGHGIKTYNPCGLVEINSNRRAKRDICYVFLDSIEPDLVLRSWPAETPGLLIFSKATGPRTGPSPCSFICGSNYHPTWELHLPVSPHVPNDLFAHHLWGNGKQTSKEKWYVFFSRRQVNK